MLHLGEAELMATRVALTVLESQFGGAIALELQEPSGDVFTRTFPFLASVADGRTIPGDITVARPRRRNRWYPTSCSAGGVFSAEFVGPTPKTKKERNGYVRFSMMVYEGAA
ncbi:MAG: hypothetical protein V1778_04125 [bacterium]